MDANPGSTHVPLWQRLLAGAALMLGLASLAGACAMLVVARCCVPPGSGLAGPGIVAGYGMMAAVGGLLVGLLLAITLGKRALLLSSGIAGAGGAIVLGLLGLGLIESRQEGAQALADAYERLPVFDLILVVPEGKPFERFEARWAERQMLVKTPGKPVCRRDLAGPQAVRLLESLRAAEGVLMRSPQPCAQDTGSALAHSLRFEVTEGRPPHTSGDVAITANCLGRHPALGAPLEAAQGVLRARGKCL